MRITMTYEITGTVDGVPWPKRGGSIEIADDEAKRLIAAGAAVAARGAVETAADASAVETASEPKKRAARRV